MSAFGTLFTPVSEDNPLYSKSCHCSYPCPECCRSEGTGPYLYKLSDVITPKGLETLYAPGRLNVFLKRIEKVASKYTGGSICVDTCIFVPCCLPLLCIVSYKQDHELRRVLEEENNNIKPLGIRWDWPSIYKTKICCDEKSIEEPVLVVDISRIQYEAGNPGARQLIQELITQANTKAGNTEGAPTTQKM